MNCDRTYTGLFVGLITLDFVYLATCAPQSNQKIVASDYTVSAGGPATNAAATFSYLGNQATLLGVVGTHPITELIKADLTNCQVELSDLALNTTHLPPISSVIITQGTGERAVVSINAMKTQVSNHVYTDILNNIDIVLIDGHQVAVGKALAIAAKTNNIPVVIDGGSWKQGFEGILPFVDYAICSANFYPPGCDNSEQAIAYLSSFGIPYIAITHGDQPIQYLSDNKIHTIDVPLVKEVVDTLGAGDIFHGAFCHFILFKSFPDALGNAAQIAANSCQAFGTRRWMDIRG